MTISGVYALTIQNTSTSINTGIVDIEIKNYKLNENNNEVEFEESEILYPGSTTSYIPKIINWGEDCYLRVKIDYINSNIDFENYVIGFSNNFTKKGEYYYYNGIVNSGEIIKLFDEITIPNNVSELTSNKNLIISIYAEAIQERNFEPDYTSDTPWGDVVPVVNAQDSVNVDIDDEMTIIIKYKDTSDKDIKVKDNFLEKLKSLMPGDIFSDSLDIQNNNNKETNYFLEIGTEEKSEIERKLLEQIELIITSENGNVIYNGKLLLENKILLKEIKPGKTEKIDFRISVPSDLSNEYTKLNPNLIFIFSDDYDGISKSEGAQNIAENKIVDTISKLINLPKTGDKVDMVITIFILSSIGLIITIILDYRERKKNIE